MRFSNAYYDDYDSPLLDFLSNNDEPDTLRSRSRFADRMRSRAAVLTRMDQFVQQSRDLLEMVLESDRTDLIRSPAPAWGDLLPLRDELL